MSVSVCVCVCVCECMLQSGCLSCPGIPSIWSDVQEVKLDVKAKKPLWTLADTLSDETPFRSRQSLSPILLFSQTKKNKTSLSRRPNSNSFRRFFIFDHFITPRLSAEINSESKLRVRHSRRRSFFVVGGFNSEPLKKEKKKEKLSFWWKQLRSSFLNSHKLLLFLISFKPSEGNWSNLKLIDKLQKLIET